MMEFEESEFKRQDVIEIVRKYSFNNHRQPQQFDTENTNKLEAKIKEMQILLDEKLEKSDAVKSLKGILERKNELLKRAIAKLKELGLEEDLELGIQGEGEGWVEHREFESRGSERGHE